jgi:hypothetical protein
MTGMVGYLRNQVNAASRSGTLPRSLRWCDESCETTNTNGTAPMKGKLIEAITRLLQLLAPWAQVRRPIPVRARIRRR